MKLILFVTFFCVGFALIDEQKVVEEIIDRDKCETCCRVLFALEYDLSSYTLNNENSDRYVIDVEFETLNQLRIDINADNVQQMRIRKLEPERTLQFWEFASYQMLCLYSYPNRVMDMYYDTKFTTPLIIWRRKAPLLLSTNNQRFVYIYDYKFMDTRHKPYSKAFIAEYYVKSTCDCNWWWGCDQYCRDHQIDYDKNRYNNQEMCYEVAIDDNDAYAYCGSLSYYNKCNPQPSGIYKRLRAQNCVSDINDKHAKLQKFIPIFA